MPAALASLIGMPAIDQCSGKTNQRGNHQQRSHSPVRESRKALNERGYPIDISKRSRESQKPNSDQEKNSPVAECLNDRVVTNPFFRLFLRSQLVHQPFLFVPRKPVRLRRPVCEIEKSDDPNDDGRSSLHNEEPAPSGQPPPVSSQ